MDRTHYTVKANLARPLRFAFVSDLHDTDNSPILAAIEKQRVDAVLVGGDFIHNNTVYQRGLDFLQLAAARWPVFAVLGNHEKRFRRDIRQLVRQSGARLLDNEFARFGEIWLGGLTSGYGDGGHDKLNQQTPPPQTDWLEEFAAQSGFKLLLNHHPEYYEPYLQNSGVDLIVSGHAHGGQWRFFGRGVFASGQGLFPKYTAGIYDGKFIVGRGLGNYNPVPRLFNRPELVILNLE